MDARRLEWPTCRRHGKVLGLVTAGRLRPIAICVFRHNDRILVDKGHDVVKGNSYYRPLGGAIEFGERAADALRREIREEIGAAITGLRLLGILENFFTFEGQPGHEHVWVYDALFVDESLYDRDRITGSEISGSLISAEWLSLEELRGLRLYPEGIYDFLNRVE